MEVTIKGDAKEIADLVLAVQGQLREIEIKAINPQKFLIEEE